MWNVNAQFRGCRSVITEALRVLVHDPSFFLIGKVGTGTVLRIYHP